MLDKQNTDDKRGRPMDLSRNQIILETTINLVSEKGYDAVTMDAVAKKAKVGKGTIYRRWATKSDLAIEAAITMCPFETSKEQINREQNLRGQLIDVLSLLILEENTNYQKAMNSICNAIAWNEQSKIREAFNLSYKNLLTHILEFKIKNNSLTNDNLQLIIDIGPALITYKNQFDVEVVTVNYIENIVDKIILPLINE